MRQQARKLESKNALLLTIAALFLIAIFGAAQPQHKTITNEGKVYAVGVEIYTNSSCTEKLSHIDWGKLKPGITCNRSLTVRNEGNLTIMLSFTTSDWQPPEMQNFSTVTWNYNGAYLDPNNIVDLTLSLALSRDVHNIASFTFNITITGKPS